MVLDFWRQREGRLTVSKDSKCECVLQICLCDTMGCTMACWAVLYIRTCRFNLYIHIQHNAMRWWFTSNRLILEWKPWFILHARSCMQVLRQLVPCSTVSKRGLRPNVHNATSITLTLAIWSFHSLTHLTACKPKSTFWLIFTCKHACPMQRCEVSPRVCKPPCSVSKTSPKNRSLARRVLFIPLIRGSMLSSAFRHCVARACVAFIPTVPWMSPPTFRLSHPTSPSAAAAGGETRCPGHTHKKRCFALYWQHLNEYVCMCNTCKCRTI